MDKIADGKLLKQCLNNLNQNACPGMDGVTFKKIRNKFDAVLDEIVPALLNGTYEPRMIRRAYIPKHKPNEFRMLGIPSVIDRMIQAAMVEVLTPIYASDFSEFSYGFQKGKSCIMALNHILEEINNGKTFAVNIDLKKFFDNVPHEKLMEILSEKITEKQVLDLIYKYLKARVYDKKQGFLICDKGVPQGGPLSPLLSNIMLNELDKYLDERHVSYSRYADDCIMVCGSYKEAQCIFLEVTEYIESVLELEINYDKSSIEYIEETEYLDYGFKKKGDVYVFDVKDKLFDDLKGKITKKIDKYFLSDTAESFAARIARVTRGWVNYYAYADIRDKLKSLDEWFHKKINSKYMANYNKVKKIYSNNFQVEYLSLPLGTMFDDKIDTLIQIKQYVRPSVDKAYLHLRKHGYPLTEELYDKIRQKWNLV